jgi:hypothetical protein
MASTTPRLIVDSLASVSNRLTDLIVLMLLALWGIGVIENVISRPGETTFDPFAIFVQTVFPWLVWKEPAAVLAVVVPLAIAFQVAVHGLRQETNSSTGHRIEISPVREDGLRRVAFFVDIATFAAAFVAVFTGATVLDRFIGQSGKPDISMAITVAISGFVTTILFLDAARVASTQDLEARLSQAQAVQRDRIGRLDSLRRDLPSRRSLWLSFGVFFTLLVVVPGIWFEPSHEQVYPVLVAKGLTTLGFALVLASTLALNFVALLMLTGRHGAKRIERILIASTVGISTVLVAVDTVLNRESGLILSYALVVLPTVAFSSMIIAWVQGTRRISSHLTHANWGFHGFLRFWAANRLTKLVDRTEAAVSRLRDALREDAVEDSKNPSNQPKFLGNSGRLWSSLTALIRR